jgi:hypothetical protein
MNARSILAGIKSKKPKLLAELQDTSTNKEDLDSLLALPLQQLSKYENFLDVGEHFPSLPQKALLTLLANR